MKARDHVHAQARGERGERGRRTQRASERRALEQRLAPRGREHAGEVPRARRRERLARRERLLREFWQGRVDARRSAVHVHRRTRVVVVGGAEDVVVVGAVGAAVAEKKSVSSVEPRSPLEKPLKPPSLRPRHHETQRLAPPKRQRARHTAAPSRRSESLRRRRQRRRSRLGRLQPAKHRRESQATPRVSARVRRHAPRAFAHGAQISLRLRERRVRDRRRDLVLLRLIQPRARALGDGGGDQRRARRRRGARAVRQQNRQLRSQARPGERGDRAG